MPIAHWMSLDHQFGPDSDGGDTPDEFPEYDFVAIVGKNEDDALGYHESSDGTVFYGSALKNTPNWNQFRILLDGDKDFRIRYFGSKMDYSYITIEISSESISEPETLKLHADTEGKHYDINKPDVNKYFVEGEKVFAKVVSTNTRRKKSKK